MRAMGALHSLQSKQKLSAEKRQETYYLNTKEKDHWIEDSVDRETTLARKQLYNSRKI